MSNRYTVCNECKKSDIHPKYKDKLHPKDILRHSWKMICTADEHECKTTKIEPVTGVEYHSGDLGQTDIKHPQCKEVFNTFYRSDRTPHGQCPYFEEREDGSELISIGDGASVSDEGSKQASS